MPTGKKALIAYSTIAAVVIIALTGVVLGQSGGSEVAVAAYRFQMVIESPGRDDVTFAGAALDCDLRLKATVGGIETAMILNESGLFILTPAIRTARNVETSDPPGVDEAGWSEWLIEPARVNPLTFHELIGEEPDVDGQVRIAAGNSVEARFSDGILQSLSFPSPSGDGTITYAYSDFEEDDELVKSDFQVPADFLTTD
jgi:hypothetical protein